MTIWFFLLILGAALTACQTGTNATPNPNPGTAPEPEPPGPLFEPSDDSDPCLSLEFVVPPQVEEGQGAALALHVTNVCDEKVERGVFIAAVPVEMYLLKDQRIHWNLLDNIPPPPLAPGVIYFDPGETRVFEGAWNGRNNSGGVVSKGTYQMVARMEVALSEDEYLTLDSEYKTLVVE